MTDQPDPLPTSAGPAARRSPGAGDAYRPLGPEARDGQSAKLLAMELSRLAGAAPNPATARRLIGVLFRAARHLLRAHRRESW